MSGSASSGSSKEGGGEDSIMVKLGGTQNQAWSKNRNKFGFKLLQKMGWKEGKGMGKNEDGIATHVRATRKYKDLGIGAKVDTTGNSTWLGATKMANDVFSRACLFGWFEGRFGGWGRSRLWLGHVKGGGELSSTPSCEENKTLNLLSLLPTELNAIHGGANEKKEKKKKKKKSKKEKKKKKKEKGTKRKREDGDDDDDDEDEDEKFKNLRYASRAKNIKSKNIKGMSKAALAEILGKAPVKKQEPAIFLPRRPRTRSMSAGEKAEAEEGEANETAAAAVAAAAATVNERETKEKAEKKEKAKTKKSDSSSDEEKRARKKARKEKKKDKKSKKKDKKKKKKDKST